MKVKICGITRVEDAVAAVEAGADAIGLIFAKDSPRFIAPMEARWIIQALPPFVMAVGVFVNASREDIMHTVAETGISCLQLHGDESPEDTSKYPLPVYKAFRVGPGFQCAALKPYPGRVYLLDTYNRDRQGGTGETFDWKVAVEAKAYGRIILSGGLTPENIASAVETVRPYAVDVNSGVESAPGIKDKEKIKRLFEALRESAMRGEGFA